MNKLNVLAITICSFLNIYGQPFEMNEYNITSGFKVSLKTNSTDSSFNRDAVADSLLLIQEGQYYSWHRNGNKFTVLTSTAINKGFGVDSYELEQRKKCYHKAFPDVNLNEEDIKEELLVEKYLNSLLEPWGDMDKVAEYYAEFLKKTPLKMPPLLNEIEPMLKFKALANRDNVAEIIGEAIQQNNEENKERYDLDNKMWELERIRLSLDSSVCLVEDPVDGLCLVNAYEFNIFVSLCRINKSFELKDARIQVLNKLLSIKHVNKYKAAGTAHYDEEVYEQQKMGIAKKCAIANAPNDSVTNEELHVLLDTYDRYYLRFFEPKNIVKIEIIASTDTMYVDSLYNKFKTIKNSDMGSRTKKLVDSFTWTQTTLDRMPQKVAEIADSLKMPIGLVKLDYCRIIYRIIKKNYQKLTVYEDAVDKIRYIVNEEKKLYGRTLNDDYVKKYYEKNIREFKTQDSVLCKLWIIPFMNKAYNDKNSVEAIASQMTVDTGAFIPLIAWTYQLSGKITDSILSNIDSNTDTAALQGPVETEFGTLYYKIIKFVPSNKVISFQDAKSTIYDKLEIHSLPVDSITGSPLCREIINSELTNIAYKEEISRRYDNISDNDIKNRIEELTCEFPMVNNKESTETKILYFKRMLFEKQVQQDFEKLNTWIKSLTINNNLL